MKLTLLYRSSVLTMAMFLVSVVINTKTSHSAQVNGALYRCADNSQTEAEIAGIQLCDAKPTNELMSRAETDNLQIRNGALVTEISGTSISKLAGLAMGDVIYRVMGVDIDTAETAAERLALIPSTQDAVVNFLRRGRPFRVQLRR